MISELGDSILHSIHTPAGTNLKAAAYGAIAHAVPDPAWSSLLYSVGFMALCWLPVLVFYRKRVFLRI
jgi:predicted acyltransferase